MQSLFRWAAGLNSYLILMKDSYLERNLSLKGFELMAFSRKRILL